MALAALGAFDGLHKGHMKVIRTAGDDPGVVFFEPVPRQVFGGLSWRKRLTTPAERYDLLRHNGISSIITLAFDASTAATGSSEFCSLLAGLGGFDGFVVGYDFRFGSNASGSISELEEGLAGYGLTVTVVDSELSGGVPVKSEKIRKLLLDGDLRGAAFLLGRTYSATGVVSRGRGVGGRLGFPTLNVRVPWSKLLPPSGSYAAVAVIGGRRFRSVAFVVPGGNVVEVHVPSLRGDFYGLAVSVEFISFLREPVRMHEEEDLKKLIRNDLERAMEVLEQW